MKPWPSSLRAIQRCFLHFGRSLLAKRETCPLFDTERFTRHIEAAYTTMWERSQRGEPPQSFAVAPIGMMHG